MRSEEKKGFIIAVIVIIGIAILAIGGVLAYANTDLFKSNQTLFFQYIGQAIEDVDYVENAQLKEIAKKKEEKPYTVDGRLQYKIREGNQDSINIDIKASVNKPEEKAYTKANLNYQNQEIFSLEYANSNDIYAIKSNEIITAFIGIENNNLKVLAQKLGILNTTAIPDSMKQTNMQDLLTITQEEKEHIKETYLPVLTKNIEKDNFKKEKDVSISKKDTNYITTAYHLELSKEKQKQVILAVLQTLKEDSITLNFITTKAKLLGLDENYTQVNLLTNKIQTQMNDIQNGKIAEGGPLSIIVYTSKGKVIATEIIQDDTKYTIYGNKQDNTISRSLIIENLNQQEENKKIEINLDEIRKEKETNYNIQMNVEDEIEINFNIENKQTGEETIETKGEVNISQGKANSMISYEQKTNFVEKIDDIIELDRNNCGVLNDYTTEQLQVLLQAVGQRTMNVINEKMQSLMSIIIGNMARESIANDSWVTFQ